MRRAPLVEDSNVMVKSVVEPDQSAVALLRKSSSAYSLTRDCASASLSIPRKTGDLSSRQRSKCLTWVLTRRAAIGG